MNISIFILFVLLSLLSILSVYYRGGKTYKYFKVLPVIVLILFSFSNSLTSGASTGILISFGLLFSLLGDILLLNENKNFKYGLAAFGVTHILYSVSFIAASEFDIHISVIFPFLFIALLLFDRLKKYFGREKNLVLTYIILISLMAFSAVNYSLTESSEISYYAGTGALLFIISDTALAFNKYKRKFKAAKFLILITYYFAQYFIVSSMV